MKVICLVKFTPDVDAFTYDYEKNVLVRDGVGQIINPEDACALGYALRLKKKYPEIEIEVVTMAPLSARKYVEDILRRRVDQATILSDPQFSGSDTIATSRIIGAYLESISYDVILTGTHTVDGDTAHVPAQIAELLQLDHMSGIVKIDETSFLQRKPLVEVSTETEVETFRIPFPAVLSISRESKIKLPFVRFADLDLEVGHLVKIVDNSILKRNRAQIGLSGSATKVVKTFTKQYEEKANTIHVTCDDNGINTVYDFLKEQGYLL